MAKKLNTDKALSRFTELADSVKKEQDAMETTDIIPIDQIVFNQDNIFNMGDSDEGIAELAENIKENGLLHNIVVAKIEPTKYLLISGERRTKAVKYLGRDKIKATIRSNLSELEILKMLFFANSETREYTTEEKVQIIEGFLTKIKQFDETGEREDAKKFKEYVSQAFRVSERQANKLIAITSELINPLKELLYADAIDINTAASLAQLPEEYQNYATEIIKASDNTDPETKKCAIEHTLAFAKQAKNIISKTNSSLSKDKTSRMYYNGRLIQANEELATINKELETEQTPELIAHKVSVEKTVSKYNAALEQLDRDIELKSKKQDSEVKKVYTNTIFTAEKGLDDVQKDKSGKIAQSKKIIKEVQAVDTAIKRLLDMNPAEELKTIQELMDSYRNNHCS